MFHSIKATGRALLPAEEPAPKPTRPRILLHRSGPSANPNRAVFLGTWGTGGLVASTSRTLAQGSQRSGAFHQVILVNDGLAKETTVSKKTEGQMIDWGKFPGPGSRSRHFDYE